MDTLAERLNTLPQTGRLEWIGIRPEPLQPLTCMSKVRALADRGLEGDHKTRGRAGSRRQVTLIQQEHLVAVGGMLHRDLIPPELVRRNLVVSGINLLALKNKRFQIGDVEFEYTGPCEPCSRMEVNLGPGGLNAMRGHGGITARILTDGQLSVGQTVRALGAAQSPAGDSDEE